MSAVSLLPNEPHPITPLFTNFDTTNPRLAMILKVLKSQL